MKKPLLRQGLFVYEGSDGAKRNIQTLQRIVAVQIENIGEAVVHPGDLPLGQLAASDDALFDGGGAVSRTIQVLPDLPVADAAHGGAIGAKVRAGFECCHFINEACLYHVLKACGDAAVQFGTRRIQGDGECLPRRRGTLLCGIVRARSFAAGHDKFEGADEALAVVRHDARRAGRIEAGEFGVQGGGSFTVQARFDSGTIMRVGGGQAIHAGIEGVVIEHGAANEDGNLSRLVSHLDFMRGIGGKTGSGIGFFRIKNVDEGVRVTDEGCSVRFGGANIHAAIDLRGIDADKVHGMTISKDKGK
ncbi:hypothetical protein HMPREF9080_01645, partial [Cardiobacterium valvarum F0432]